MDQSDHPQALPKSPTTGEGRELPRDSPLVPNISAPPQDKQGTCHFKPDLTPLWKKVLETAAVLIGAIVAIIYGCQLNQMIKSNKLTRESLIASSRAWISPTSAGFEETPQQGKPLKFGVQYGNPGRSPAFDVRPTYKIRSVPKSSFDDNSIKGIIESDDICKGVVEAVGADVIYPEQPNGYRLEFQTSEPNFINDPDIFNGMKVFVTEMCFAYKTFGKLHHTSFCYFYQGGTSKVNQWSVCTAGNHAD